MAKASRHRFVRVPPALWRLAQAAPRSLGGQFEVAPPYQKLVVALANSAQLVAYRREPCKAFPGHYRLSATFRCSRSLLKLFHSGPTGYRAQFYASPAHGERADHLARNVFALLFLEHSRANLKRSCRGKWLAASLCSPSAKVWIHQGAWIRPPRVSDRLLEVDRWCNFLPRTEPQAKRKIFATLIPRSEDRIDLKGGFVTLDGIVLRPLKADRAGDIHRQGYT